MSFFFFHITLERARCNVFHPVKVGHNETTSSVVEGDEINVFFGAKNANYGAECLNYGQEQKEY